jgi:hypothetical protein
MNKRKKHILLNVAKLSLLLVIIAFASCRKIVSYPPEPEIKFVGAEFEDGIDELGNVVLLYVPTISFTDGDGNIGSLSNGKVLRPCDVSNTHDYYMNLYEKINGTFVKRDFEENYRCIDSSTGKADSLVADNVGLDVFLTYLEGRGQSNSLIGEIENKVTISFLNSDTIKYDFQLCDRDNNYSNIVESPIYIIKNGKLVSIITSDKK